MNSEPGSVALCIDSSWLQGSEHLGEPCNVVLAHLVAARAAEQQRNQVGLLDAQAGGVLGQFVAHRETMHAALAGQLVELVEFQPKPLGDRAVQLAGADQRPAQAADRPLDADREQLRASRLLRGASWTTISL